MMPKPIVITFLIVILAVTLARADSPNRVGLIVVHGDDDVITQCIEFSEDEINGLDVLELSGLDFNIEVSGGMGAAVCRIDNEGCTYPEQQCWCQCQGTSCIFWSYWHLTDDNKWQFSSLGASNIKVRDGDLQGWVWGKGSPSGGGSPPPAIEFDEICEPLPTATPSPTNTSLPPTDTPIPTDTPKPTNTPTPDATPVIHHFTADRYTINAGESVVLNWDLSNAKAAYLRYDGIEEGVIAPGSKTVLPNRTTIYTLVARNDGGEASIEITITVNGSPPAPTSTDTPRSAPESTPPGDTPGPPAEPSAPEPIINFTAAAPTLPVGACTTLRWDVKNAGTVYLDQLEVSHQGTQEACPAQTQVYNLRAVYPGGERTAELTLEVVAPITVPPDRPLLTPTVSSTIMPMVLATATPNPIALAPSDSDRPQPSLGEERNSKTSQQQAETRRSEQVQRFISYGLVLVILTLFLVVPIGLLAIGGLTWWFRRHR